MKRNEEDPLKNEKLHVRVLVRSLLLLDKVLQPLVRRTTGRYKYEKALTLLLFFVGAVAFIAWKAWPVLAVLGGFALILSPLFLTAPGRRVSYRNFWNNPSGGGFKGNYYNNDN